MSINKDSQKTPNLRFKGFTDDWEQRRFFDTINSIIDYRGRTPKKLGMTWSDQGYLALSALNVKSGYIDRSADAKYGSEELYEKWMGKTPLRKGVVLFTTEAPMGNVAIVPDDEGYILSQRTIALDAKTSIMSNLFLATILITPSVIDRLLSLSSGGTAKGVSQKSLSALNIVVPNQLEEQSKISKLLSLMENTITLHQRKLDQLNQLKEALLQQMFPGKGETVPKLRFAGFEGDWEERKLGELGETKSGIGFPDDEQGGKKGIPFFKVSDMNNIGNEHELKNSNNYVDTEQLKKRNWKPIMNVPAVIFAKVGAAIMLNRKRIVRMPFLLDNNTMAYIFDDSWNSDFGKILFETIYLPRYAQVGALPSYNGSDINNIKVFIPNKKEQEKIGVFFKEMDSLISLQQRKLDQLKNMKQVLLQNMFI